MKILDTRKTFKPFVYEWAIDYYKKQAFLMFWNPDEVSFKTDIDHFSRLDNPEKEFIKKIFTFFVQSDHDIGAKYVDAYLPRFKHSELRMMLLSFAHMESNHAQAYAKLIDSLGFTDYEGFLEYPEMVEKHSYLEKSVGVSTDIPNLMRDIAITSGFGEGLQLFGSFIMLLSFVERGLLPGMGDIVSWSLRDEQTHVEGLAKIFHTLKSDYPEHWTDDTKRSIYQACRDMVELEDRFISLVYSDDLVLPNLPKEDLHKYIRFLADYRLNQLGLKPNYYVTENPIKWLSKFVGETLEDLFNNTGSNYTRNSQDWEDIF